MHGVSVKRAVILVATALAATQTAAAAHATTAMPAKHAAITCGETITVSIVVTNNLTCSGDALYIAADNVTVDLAGHTLTGDGTGTGVTISPADGPGPQNADTVEHGTITAFASGVTVALTQNTTVSALTLSGDGAALATRRNEPVQGLNVADSTILNSGVVLNASLELAGLAVTHTGIQGGGFFLSQASGPIRFDSDQLTGTALTFDNQGAVTIADSKLTDSPVISRYFFGGDVFEDNTFTGAGTALQLFDELNETVTGNTFTGNDIGLDVTADVNSLGGNTITANTFTKNSTAGVLVDISADTGASIALNGNIAKRNGAHPDGAADSGGNPVRGGLHIYIPNGDATIADNQTAHNSGFGVWALANSISGSGNVSLHDQFQCDPLTRCSY